MKKIMIVLLLVGFMGGCGGFRNEAQYNRGDWDFWMSAPEIAQLKEDQIELKEMNKRTQTTKNANGVFRGYEGIVANFDPYRRVNIEIKKIDVSTGVARRFAAKSYFLGPGNQKKDYLTPGTYEAIFSIGGIVVDKHIFRVTIKLLYFFGKNVHWYAVYDRY